MGCATWVYVLLFHIAVMRSNFFSLHRVNLFIRQGRDLICDLEVGSFEL